MRDRFLLPLMVLLGAGMIWLSLQWPQGQGAPSPAPFTRPLAPLPPPVASPAKDSADKAAAVLEAAKPAPPPKPRDPGGLRPAQ